MNLTITQDNTRTEILGSEGSSLAHKLYEIASDLNNTVSLTGSISVPYAYADEVEYLNTNYGPNFNITAGGTWIKFYHQEIEDSIISWASLNPNSVGANFASSGHITQADADSITNWSKTFTGNTNITQFNEFEKFRNVTQVSLNDCFLGCTNLQSIKLPPRLTNIRGWMFNGCSSLSGVVLPASCTTIDRSGFINCTSLTSINLSNVTTIGNNAFEGSALSGTISLPSLTSFGLGAFKNCTGITSVNDLGSITSIPTDTFKGCTALTSVTLPSTLTSIGGSAFAGCTSLQINGSDLSNVTSISAWAFADITINGTAILSSLSYMTDRIFINSKVTSIDFTGSSITTIRNNMCTYVSQLTSVTLSPTITTIEGNAFMLTGLTSIDLSNITNIGNAVFMRCGSLSSVTSMGNIVSIGDEAFRYCTTLHTVDLGANLTSVGQNAFGNSGITTFIFRSTTPPAYSGKFIDNMTGVTIYVPDAVVLDYQTAWPDMASNITGLTNYSAS